MKIADFMAISDEVLKIDQVKSSSIAFRAWTGNDVTDLHLSLHTSHTEMHESVLRLMALSPLIVHILRNEILGESDPDDFTPLQSKVDDIIGEIADISILDEGYPIHMSLANDLTEIWGE